MVSKKAAVTIAIFLVLLIGVVHGFLHSVLFGTGIPGFYQSGSPSFNIFGSTLLENYNQKYFFYSLPSKITLIFELSLLIFFLFMLTVLNKNDGKDEKYLMDLKEKYLKEKHTTDLDILYNILKEKKRLEIGKIPKLFAITKLDAENWSEILESGNLAVIHAPKIGDRELVLNE